MAGGLGGAVIGGGIGGAVMVGGMGNVMGGGGGAVGCQICTRDKINLMIASTLLLRNLKLVVEAI